MMKTGKRPWMAVAGIVSIVLFSGMLLLLHAPGRSMAATLAEEPAADPNAGQSANAINTTLLDFQLPGTQPGGLAANPLQPAENCTSCHVDHIKDNFNGSMMTNGVRDPLFRAALVIANKDAGFGGDLCIRCHSPTAWLNNRSNAPGDPASTDGRFINAEDLHGIPCSACHRMVPHAALAGEAAGDAAERAALTGPFILGSSAYIIDRNDVRRGPFNVAAAPHAVAQSSLLQSAEMCATCHDIDNPLLTFNAGSGEFELNTLNTPAAAGDRLFPLDRSYSEWAASEFASTGVSGLDYPNLKRSTGTTNGPITVCQDCHMPMIASKIANGGPDRTVGMHQWVGANTSWQDGIIQVWDNVAGDTRFDKTQTTANKTLSANFLQLAADLDVAVVNGQLAVTVTNNTGHKLPTGYAEGRRMWLEIYQLRGATPVFTSGLMAGVVGPLINDPYLKKYEVKLGLSDDHAQEIGRPELAGEGFHIILNNKIFKDNRIPPRGFTNAAFAARDMEPVGVVYPDGQYWDTTFYPIHPEATEISVRLMYQTASTEYLDFLASEANLDVTDAVSGTINWGETIDGLRAMNIGKPAVIASGHLFFPREYVATSGNDTGFCNDPAAPCRTISYALWVAGPETEIRVAGGVYPEQVLVTQTVALVGGFTTANFITPTWTLNQTILDGQNAYRPLTVNADNVRIDGFTVRNGNANGDTRTGGGIFIGAVNVAERATLANLRLENNIASKTDDGDGGGLAVQLGNTFNITGLLSLNNVTVFSNTASTGHLGSSGGGMSILAVGNSALNVEMISVTVEGNTAGNDFRSQGGGVSMSLNGGTATLKQTRFLNNQAAQIKTFLGGASQGGGLFASGGHLRLENVLMAGNAGEQGGALWVDDGNLPTSTVALNYVTLADNVRTNNDTAAAIWIEGAAVILPLDNTLISGNPIAFEAFENPQPPRLELSSVLIDNNVSTVMSGTITVDGTPLRGSAGYKDAAAGDYLLTAASDAVDAGNGLPPPYDLDGVARPQGVTTDIGAYEFVPPGQANQTITFNPLPDKFVGDPPFGIAATASSGLPVSFTSQTTAVCTVSGNTVTLVATGTCRIQADQAGNASFKAASPVVQAFSVKSAGKTEQTITFTKPPDKQLGNPPFGLSASASSGLPVSFFSNTPGICTVAGSTVTLVAVGACSITATQDGNATFNPATPVTRSFLVLSSSGGGKTYLPSLLR